MPRNGSGSYNLPAGNPVVPSTVISSTWANTTLSDLGTAITQSIANDGQTTPVANLPMATFRHTNVGNAVARTDYAAAGQVQDSSLQWLTSVAGTDTITASITPSPTAYAAGQIFRFTAAGSNTTTAVTLNINGLGAKNITKNGAIALAVGDILSGKVVEVVYDGTQFQLTSVAHGTMASVFANSPTSQSIPQATVTDITNWTEVRDQTNSFVPTTGVFTAPRAGLYLVTAAMSLQSGAWLINSTASVIVARNGTIITQAIWLAQASTNYTAFTPHASIVVSCAAGDTLKIQMFQNSGGALNTTAASTNNFVTITELQQA